MSRPRRWVQARATATLTAATALCLLAASLGQVAQAAPPVPAAVAAVPAAQEAPQTAFDQQMVGLINGARTQAGLSAVSAAAGLTQLSVDWSTTMATGGTGYVLKHNPDAWTQLPNYGAASRTSWAENVASWTSGAYSAQDIFTSYMNSPGHRANIMNPAFRFVGVGTVSGGNGSDYNTMTFTDKVDAGSSGGGTTPAPTSPSTPAPTVQGNRDPMGSWEGLSSSGAVVRLSGWGFDPDVSNRSINVDVYDQRPDGTTVGKRITTDVTRSDVNRVFGGIGGAHGFDTEIRAAGAGQHTICAFLIDGGGGGSNALLGCRTVTVGSPIGSLDSVVNTSTGQLDVSGWAADPSSFGAGQEVHVYVTGPAGRQGFNNIRTGQARTDVGGVFAWAGGGTGFRTQVPAQGEGRHQVCVYAISAAPPAVNPSIGCTTIDVRNTFGALDAIVGERGQFTLSGWALNPNVPAEAVQLHVYDNGPAGLRATSGILAGTSRPDVAAAFRWPGDRHGFSTTITAVTPGVHSICVFAIATGGYSNTVVGCRTVTVS